jgi:hypothetical protein
LQRIPLLIGFGASPHNRAAPLHRQGWTLNLGRLCSKPRKRLREGRFARQSSLDDKRQHSRGREVQQTREAVLNLVTPKAVTFGVPIVPTAESTQP